jgi:hypothetical protein
MRVASSSIERSASDRGVFCARLQASIPTIIAWWENEVTRAPWTSLSHGDLVDHWPPYLETMFDWAFCASNGTEQARRFIDAAATHGIQRRKLNFDYDVIMEESALLRRAIWAVTAPTFEDRHDMVNIDSALTVGLMASLRGFAKPELTRDGQWEASLTELAAEWSYTLAR